MADSDDYTPPKVWTWDAPSGGRFASINRPTAGAVHDAELPVGKQPLQLYSLATPNGQKVTILLEELLERGHSGAEYDAWKVDISEGEQFGSGFVAINPNSKFRPWSTAAEPSRCACSNPAQSCCGWRKNSASSCLPRGRNARKPCRG